MKKLSDITSELRNTQEECQYQYLKTLSKKFIDMITAKEEHNDWQLKNILLHACTQDDEIGLYISYAFGNLKNNQLEPETIEMISQEDYGVQTKAEYANEKTMKDIQYIYQELFQADKRDISQFIANQLRTNVICFLKENQGENAYIHFNEKDNTIALKKMLGKFYPRYEKEELENSVNNIESPINKKFKV